MATLKHSNIVPPGGWRYVQPETGTWMQGEDESELRRKVFAHRIYKGLPTEDVAGDIQRQMCITLGQEWCKAAPGENYVPIRDLTSELTTEMAKNFGRAITKFLASGSTLVDKAEAQRRAAICRSCPLNKSAKLCSCSAVYTVVEMLVPAERKEPGISVCMACGCSLQAKVNLPKEVIDASVPADLPLPSWCWQRHTPTPT